jgi:hypothetical protein
MKKYLLVLMIFILAGCMQNIRFHDTDTQKRTPNISYEALYYVEGSGDKSRAVFLRHPEAPIDVVASSPQITATTSTYGDAIAYMNETRGLRKVITRFVTYKDKPLGYLISFDDDHSATETTNHEIVIEIYEFKGAVHFKAAEKLDQSD